MNGFIVPVPFRLKPLSTGEIGEIGEQAAVEWLQAQGFKNVSAIRNPSNHGIDFKGELNGETWFFEVKATTGMSPPPLSKAQSDLEGFVMSRLSRAAEGTGPWKNASPATRTEAREMLRQLRAGEIRVQGKVIEVRGVGGPARAVKAKDWK